MKTLANIGIQVVFFAIAAFVAWILVNAFDSWYHDKEQRRATKRDHKDHPANGGPRYE